MFVLGMLISQSTVVEPELSIPETRGSFDQTSAACWVSLQPCRGLFAATPSVRTFSCCRWSSRSHTHGILYAFTDSHTHLCINISRTGTEKCLCPHSDNESQSMKEHMACTLTYTLWGWHTHLCTNTHTHIQAHSLTHESGHRDEQPPWASGSSNGLVECSEGEWGWRAEQGEGAQLHFQLNTHTHTHAREHLCA